MLQACLFIVRNEYSFRRLLLGLWHTVYSFVNIITSASVWYLFWKCCGFRLEWKRNPSSFSCYSFPFRWKFIIWPYECKPLFVLTFACLFLSDVFPLVSTLSTFVAESNQLDITSMPTCVLFVKTDIETHIKLPKCSFAIGSHLSNGHFLRFIVRVMIHMKFFFDVYFSLEIWAFGSVPVLSPLRFL